MGPIAQSVEQRTFNPWVDGSSPSGPTFSKHILQITKALPPRGGGRAALPTRKLFC